MGLVELHGFSDASFQNYGACIYVRSVSQSGKISVSLVSANSRPAPMKPPTIPRLELLGNLLLSRLTVSVENGLSKVLQILKKYFWTDSQVTVAWILHKGRNLKPLLKTECKKSVETVTGATGNIAKLSITLLIF